MMFHYELFWIHMTQLTRLTRHAQLPTAGNTKRVILNGSADCGVDTHWKPGQVGRCNAGYARMWYDMNWIDMIHVYDMIYSIYICSIYIYIVDLVLRVRRQVPVIIQNRPPGECANCGISCAKIQQHMAQPDKIEFHSSLLFIGWMHYVIANIALL